MPVYPKDALAAPPTGIGGNCFVLMPFDKKFDRVLSVIELACESLQLSCSRADDVARAGHVMERVLNGILQAEYIIADLTGKNPNVFYELGIAHSCKPPSNVIIISQNAEDVPFDIRSMNYLMYQSNGPSHKQLKRQLTEAIRGEGYRFSIESGKQFELMNTCPEISSSTSSASWKSASRRRKQNL
jgi:hypothetical protein